MTSAALSLDRATIDRYVREGHWGTETLTDLVRRNAADRPQGLAFVEGNMRMSWHDYERWSSRIAGALVAAGFRVGERIGVQLRDTPLVHAVHLGAEKAGMTVVGLGLRAGVREMGHVLLRAGAVGLIGEREVRGAPTASIFRQLVADGLPLRAHLHPEDVDPSRNEPLPDSAIDERRLGPNDLYLVNSTSGTTGLPKVVTQFENRWFAFHRLAAAAAAMNEHDVFMSLIPAPYGFAQWTAKFTPTILGCPCVLMSRFDADAALELIERHRVTVLMCVSTQFVMLLNAPTFGQHDLSSLRCMFTGGEAIPYARAAEFEAATGATILQFFGSNETGALSYTTLEMGVEARLRTAGHVIPFMNVRLFNDGGADVTASGGPGQPGCRGPLTSLGYLDDPKANRELITPDGWMLTGDVCVLEGQTLRVVGRTSDFIIRGGKNISAASVEEDVCSHPSVALAAAVPVPDAVYGERVACYVVLKPGASVDLDDLRDHLARRGSSVETWPEQLVVVTTLPMSSGGKIAKSELREDARRRSIAEGAAVQ